MAQERTRLTLQSMVDSIIRTARAGGVPTDDEKWNDYHIMWLINNYREEFIYHNAYLHGSFTPDIDEQIVQDLGCVPLETVDQSECPTLPWCCTVKKVSNLPKVVDFPDMAGLTFVGAINKRTNYNYVPRETLEARMSLRFSGVTTFWYMVGQSLYVVSQNPLLCNINIAGVFTDPTAVCKFTNGGNPCCFNKDTDFYPVSRRMAQDIQHSIEANEIKEFLQTVGDEQNNSVSI